MVGMNPLELMALMQAQFRHDRLVPPILASLSQAAAASLTILLWSRRQRALARVNVEPCVGCDEGRVGPVRLHTPALRGPVISVPNRAVDAHGLIFWKRHAFELFV